MPSKTCPISKVKLKTQDHDLVQYLMLLRFGPGAASGTGKPLLSYTAIAKLTRIPYRTVIDLIKVGVKAL